MVMESSQLLEVGRVLRKQLPGVAWRSRTFVADYSLAGSALALIVEDAATRNH